MMNQLDVMSTTVILVVATLLNSQHTLGILMGNCTTKDFTNTILNSSTMMVITLNKCRAMMTVLPSPIRFCEKAHEP